MNQGLCVGHNSDLWDTVKMLWANAIQPSTRAAYSTGLSTFRRFIYMDYMLDQACVINDLFPPVTEHLLIFFVAHCVQRLHLAHSTIKLYLTGIRFCYLQAGLHNPMLDSYGTPHQRLPILLRSIKKSHSNPRLIRLPITFTVLSQLCTVLRAGCFGPYLDLLMEAACTTAFFGFLRCGEFTTTAKFDPASNLCIGDLSHHSKGCTLTLKASKTDPFRQGIDIHLFTTNHSICPAKILQKYCQVRLKIAAASDEPLFITPNGQPLTRDYFISKLKSLICRIGRNQLHYSGHSFRIGAATSCAEARLEGHLIQMLGRWSSDCYIRYIRTPLEVLKDAQLALITK